MLEWYETDITLLTHPIVPAGPIPTAQDPEGIYPYESFTETSRRPVLKKYRLVMLENDLLRVAISPDLGGRVYSIYMKKAEVETLFVSRVIRPVRILPRHFFIGGGIEVSFPISHTPVQMLPVLYRAEHLAGRAYVWCGERELRFGMHWTVEYSLGEADPFLTQRTLFFNPDDAAQPWMSWSNAGIPARPDTEFHFPNGPVLFHGHEMKIIDWATQGPRRQSDVHRMAGFFWRKPHCCAFGAFTPSLGSGLYHVADPALTPGIKLWTDGVGPHQEWVSQYTLNRDQCLEIQAGPLIDQSIKDHLQPGQQRHHIEFWIPSNTPLDIETIGLPSPPLQPIERMPRFGWARQQEVSLWEELSFAFRNGQIGGLPSPPDLDDNRWAVSGMPELGQALRWACSVTEGSSKGQWAFQLGAWLAGRDQIDEALESLRLSGDDRARALAGCLLRRGRHDPRGAVECFRAIGSEALALHAQVVFERDLALAALGKETLEERAHWLDAVSALEDEWLIERRVSLLIDQGKSEEARALLSKTKFQLVHQRYARTRLWRQIEQELGLTSVEPPAWLGEDDLAEFGAYREYPE
ncbi:MAG TPA: DUF5107 domain-containing protein [Terriglobia bacterium]|nr:DUF5107 domain-containing protein [Terriglobia bacterium]